jgi:hypothetical protein
MNECLCNPYNHYSITSIDYQRNEEDYYNMVYVVILLLFLHTFASIYCPHLTHSSLLG